MLCPPQWNDAGADAGGSAAHSGASEWTQRGRWDYVVGLVGKPSAGKSTFFNAVTGGGQWGPERGRG